MPKYKQLRRRPRVAAVLIAQGVAAPTGRPRYASYGAGVPTAGAVPLGVDVLTEAQVAALPAHRRATLTRFAPGTPIPPGYRLVAELAGVD